MAQRLVFSGNLDPASANLSTRFIGATAFIIEAPTLGAELEIDVFLQVYIVGFLGEVARNIPLGKIESQAIILNVSDTETATAIPIEYQNTGLEMALLFLASEATFLYATAIEPDCDLGQIYQQNKAIETRLIALQLDLQLIKNAVGIPVLATAPTSAEQSFFFLQ